MADPITLALASGVISGGIGAMFGGSGGGGGAAQAAPAAPTTLAAPPSPVQQPTGSPSGAKSGIGASPPPSFVGSSAIPQQSNSGTKTLTGQ